MSTAKRRQLSTQSLWRVCFLCRSATLPKHVAKGAEAAGAEVQVFQVGETLSAEVLTKVRSHAQAHASTQHPPAPSIEAHL